MKFSGNGMAGYEYLQCSESQTKHSPSCWQRDDDVDPPFAALCLGNSASIIQSDVSKEPQTLLWQLGLL